MGLCSCGLSHQLLWTVLASQGTRSHLLGGAMPSTLAARKHSVPWAQRWKVAHWSLVGKAEDFSSLGKSRLYRVKRKLRVKDLQLPLHVGFYPLKLVHPSLSLRIKGPFHGWSGWHNMATETENQRIISSAPFSVVSCILRQPRYPVTDGNGYPPEYHLQHLIDNEQDYHQLFLLDLSVLVSNQLTLDGGLGSTWLEWKKKKELKALGSRSLTVGIRCRAPPHGNCTNMQGKNESCALASRGDEWHRLFLCKIVAKCHQVRLNLEIRVRCGWNLGVELLLFKAWKSHPGFGCSVSIPCSALQMGWTVLPAVFSCIYKYLFMNFWEAKNLQA